MTSRRGAESGTLHAHADGRGHEEGGVGGGLTRLSRRTEGRRISRQTTHPYKSSGLPLCTSHGPSSHPSIRDRRIRCPSIPGHMHRRYHCLSSNRVASCMRCRGRLGPVRSTARLATQSCKHTGRWYMSRGCHTRVGIQVGRKRLQSILSPRRTGVLSTRGVRHRVTFKRLETYQPNTHSAHRKGTRLARCRHADMRRRLSSRWPAHVGSGPVRSSY